MVDLSGSDINESPRNSQTPVMADAQLKNLGQPTLGFHRPRILWPSQSGAENGS